MSFRFRNTFLEVDLAALRHNFKKLESLFGKPKSLCPMVKADGYGHGAVEIARECESLGALHLGVALIEEGIELRDNKIQSSILVFGDFDQIGAEALLKYNLTPVVSKMSQLKTLDTVLNKTTEFPIHLKFNTGMNRLGLDPGQAQEVCDFLNGRGAFNLKGVCTHFASSEDFSDQHGETSHQIKRFTELKKFFDKDPEVKFHYCNSGALFTNVTPRMDFARPGISLYGSLPSLPGHLFKKFESELNPVLQLKTYVGFIQKVKKGGRVSYGGTWVAPKDSVIAVLPCGYGDGVPRHLSNQGSVLIRGQRCPIRGIVCMDYILVDVTSVTHDGPAIDVGEEVVIVGKQGDETILVEELAKISGTITYEILTGFRGRLPRVYVNEL